jgi:hypothetical protein
MGCFGPRTPRFPAVNLFIAWMALVAVIVVPISIWQIVVAGRHDGPDARAVFGRAPVPDSHPLATTRLLASESGPMPFGWDRITMDVHPDAIVLRFSPTPLVVPIDRIGGLEHHRGLGGSSWIFLGPSGERTSLHLLASRGNLRRTLSAGGALAVVDAPGTA